MTSESETRRYGSENKVLVSSDGWSHGVLKSYNGSIRVFPKVICQFTTENWRKMGDAISRDSKIKGLSFSSCDALTEEAMEALFGMDRTCVCPLERIDFSRIKNHLALHAVVASLPLLKSFPRPLKELDFTYTCMGKEEAKMLSDALSVVSVEKLVLPANDIKDEGVEYMLLAPNAIRGVTKLDLWQNCFGRCGYEAIARFLAREDTALKSIQIGSRIDENYYPEMIADSISPRSNLEELMMWENLPHEDDNPMLSALENMEKLVCNTASFESLCESNHQLYSFIGNRNIKVISHLRPALEEAISINMRSQAGASVAQRIRAKLRAFYFKGNFSTRPFSNMDIVLMPHVLELVTRRTETMKDDPEMKKRYLYRGQAKYYALCRGNLGGIYHILRSCHIPDLFGFPSPETKTRELEARIAALERQNEMLALENRELRDSLPEAKRCKTVLA